ncbi:tape measure protein [Acinetobacter stercoris]|uniref:Tape measure protein N-terminal domain-containing protein n=1 Tax=Acinetobacter stercoris TaxID=2126983 RepID=A0A2U3MY68_9GAMM|nr:tape measure protein [Acinetobacter stercoris]SPL70303.1 hypothetical protein KPC_1481 [Acinetobacter stercoris]
MSDLTFKLVMQGENSSLISTVKQSESTTKTVFDAIKREADKLRESTSETAKEIGNIIPQGTSELANQLSKSLNSASEMIKNAGDDAQSTAKNFTDFGNKAEKALTQLRRDLELARNKLNEFSKTDASPQDIEIAKQQVDKLEQEVRQADQAFGGFKQAVSSANNDLKNTESASRQAQQAISGLKTGYTALAGALAAVGIGLSAKQIIETADSYTNLSTRVKIAVGDTGNFEQAMSGVHQVALMTNSNLESTAGLFTKVNDVGQKMGLTQQQNLDLVKTINMAIQTGGGSAQATEAALQQLTQALQSGVLRGDEFNSMAEQAPGLLKALANGLGVTTGELRNMANEGQLTSSVVIKALESQSGAVSAEYAKFPLTIGKALQRIQTQWQILIGEMDKANGASATVAQWLATLADNMDVVDVLLKDIGNGFIWVGDQIKHIDPATIQAMKDVLSSTYETIKTFAGTLGTAFEGLSDKLNSSLELFLNFSSGVDTAQDKTNGFTKFLQALNIALGYVNDGFSAIGIGVNLFIGTLYDLNAAFLQLSSLVTFGSWKDAALANMDAMARKAQEYYQKASNGAIEFKSKGEQAWIDISKTQQEKDAESVASSKAKLDQLLADQQTEVQGKKATEQEKLNAVKAYAEASMQANKGVLDGTVQADLLAKGYAVTISETGKVTVTAMIESATAIENNAKKLEAVKLATENLKKADEELLNFQKQAAIERIQLEQKIAIAKASGDLNTLKSAQDSLTLLDQKEAELTANREKRLSELNLANTNSGANAETAYTKASDAAKILGIDIEQSLNKVSKKFNESGKAVDNLVAQFPALGISGKQAGDITYEAWQKWLDSAKSQAEVDLAKQKLKEFETQGVFSTKQVESGMLAIQQVLQKLPDEADPVEQAFERLGIKTKEHLKLAAQSALADFNTIQASGRATADGLKQAYDRVVQSAYASGDAASIASANSKAAYLGLQVTVDEVGKATVSAMEPLEQSMHRVRNATDGAKQGFRQLGQVARDEAQSSTDAWNEAMNAKSEKASQERNSGGRREGQSFTSYTLQDVIQKLSGMGYDEADASKYAKNIMLKATEADKSQAMSNRNEGKIENAEAFEALIKQGKTSIYGTNVIEELLVKYANGAGSASTGSSGKTANSNNDRGSNENVSSSNSANNLSSNANQSNVQSGSSSSKTVTFVFTLNNQRAELSGTDNAGQTLEAMLRQLELIQKSS